MLCCFLPPTVADCSSVTPKCHYQVDGKHFPVNGPLPGRNGRTWRFVAGANPSADNQVACSVPGHPALTPTFSHSSRACGRTPLVVKLTVNPNGNACSSDILLDPYEGKLPALICCKGHTSFLVCGFVWVYGVRG
jgi:hypothetical protein